MDMEPHPRKTVDDSTGGNVAVGLSARDTNRLRGSDPTGISSKPVSGYASVLPE
jgi:hypothetical protein